MGDIAQREKLRGKIRDLRSCLDEMETNVAAADNPEYLEGDAAELEAQASKLAPEIRKFASTLRPE